MKNLILFGGAAWLGWNLFGNRIRQALNLGDVNTFNVVGINNLSIKRFPTIEFNIRAEYINNTDINLPIDNLIVKMYKVEDSGREVEIANSNPTSSITFPARETKRFNIPLATNLTSSGLTILSLVRRPTIRVRVWITAKNVTVQDSHDFNLG